MKQEQADRMYLQICQVIAAQSYAQRAKVGAVIVKDNNILSFGFNGTPAGRENICEYTDYQAVPGCDKETESKCENKPHCKWCNLAKQGMPEMHTKQEVLHAESNAFMKLCKSGTRGSDGATLYVTYSPCIECAKMAIQAGIKRVVYMIPYRDDAGLKLLRECNVQTENINLDESEVMYE